MVGEDNYDFARLIYLLVVVPIGLHCDCVIKRFLKKQMRPVCKLKKDRRESCGGCRKMEVVGGVYRAYAISR